MKKRLITLTVAVCLLIIFTAGAFTAVAADNSVYIKVGVYENEPKIFTDENGKPSGFWPDIIEYIASQEGWEIQWVHGTWQECLERLQNNEIDIMPDVAYSEDRAAVFDFSQETVYVSWSRVYAQKGSSIQTIPDLSGKSIAILKNSINIGGPEGIKTLTTSFGVNPTFIETDSYLKVFQLLDSRQADAGAVSKDFANTNAQDFNVTQTDIIFQPALLFFTFPPDSLNKSYLMGKIDNQVKLLKADGDSLYYQSLDKWLGATPLEKPVFPPWAKWLLVSIASLALVLGAGYLTIRNRVNRKTKELAQEIAGHKQTEEDLRESEHKLREAQDIASLGYWHWNVKTGDVKWSDEVYKLFGLDPVNFTPLFDSILAMSPRTEEHQHYKDLFNQAIQSHEPGYYEQKFLRPDQSIGYYFSNFHGVYDASGDLLSIFGTVLDITERKKAELDLKESEEKYRRRLDSMLEGCQIIDNQWRYIYLNNAAVKHSHKAKEELLGHTMMEVYPNIENAEFFLNLKRCMEDRVPNRMENLFSYNDGSHGWFELSMEPVPEGVFILSIDISERKKMEQSLIESEQTLRHMFEAVPEGIVFTDVQGIILETNQTVVDMHGYQDKNEILGKNINEFMADQSDEESKISNQRLIETGVDRKSKHTFIRKDGSTFPAEMSTAVVKDNSGKLFGFIVLTSDTTARDQAEEEHRKVVEYREMDRLKTNLISTISHELRTPLASIKGYATLLLAYEHKLARAQKTESIAAIDRATDRLTELIEHLLDMSRLDAGLLKLTLQPVQPEEIIKTAVEEAQMRSPDFHFINKTKGGLPELTADGRRLRQVIDNILENATKYSPKGTEVKLTAIVKGDDLLISIADQGRGIKESEYSKIFERMYRIEQRLQEDPGGLGLGLSLCKALVEGHGGKIWVESTIGKGSTFYFTIPLKAVEKGTKKDEREPTKTGIA
jgi:PAS domain S-box-containing protein